MRRLITAPDRGAGVATYGTYRVSQRAAGANMSVDVNMDDVAYVRGAAVTFQGIYNVAPHSATVNEAISTADATNPRIDRVILEVKDTQHDASGSNLAQTRVIAGTPTGGATLDNLTGAGAVPSSALLLADVLVGTSVSSIVTANIRDRRAVSAPGSVPTPFTGVDMVVPTSPLVLSTFDVTADLTNSSHDLHQTAGLIYIPRKIVSATKIRWKYLHGATAAVGNYVLGVFDASGRKIIDTGSVAFTGSASTWQVRSETITATTFEPGWYYGFLGVDTSAGAAGYIGWSAHGILLGTPVDTAPAANLLAASAAGGVTVPTTILSFTDEGTSTSPVGTPKLPQIALSVG